MGLRAPRSLETRLSCACGGIHSPPTASTRAEQEKEKGGRAQRHSPSLTWSPLVAGHMAPPAIQTGMVNLPPLRALRPRALLPSAGRVLSVRVRPVVVVGLRVRASGNSASEIRGSARVLRVRSHLAWKPSLEGSRENTGTGESLAVSRVRGKDWRGRNPSGRPSFIHRPSFYLSPRLSAALGFRRPKYGLTPFASRHPSPLYSFAPRRSYSTLPRLPAHRRLLAAMQGF